MFGDGLSNVAYEKKVKCAGMIKSNKKLVLVISTAGEIFCSDLRLIDLSCLINDIITPRQARGTENLVS